jgi:hypothetical protein
MKRLIIGIFLLFIISTMGLFASYITAREQAEKVAQSFPGSLSPLRTQLALFGAPELTPCWVFRAEYADAMTGATFDVYVSLLGSVLKIPPKSKMPE